MEEQMIFRIKQKHKAGFSLWLEMLGYFKKVLVDGSMTFSGKGTRKALSYVFLSADLSGNTTCQALYEEYQLHLVSPLVGLKVTLC